MALSEKDDLKFQRKASVQSFEYHYHHYCGKFYNFVLKITKGYS